LALHHTSPNQGLIDQAGSNIYHRIMPILAIEALKVGLSSTNTIVIHPQPKHHPLAFTHPSK
jgi:hypothetical protein